MTPKCLVDSCLNISAPAMKRGLCMLCYSRAKKMVEAGTTTWEKLEALGLALPANTEDGSTDPFTVEFTKRSSNAKRE